MNRKTVWILILFTLASIHPAGAQQPTKVPRIGFIAGSGGHSYEAFRQGLRDLGYVEGKSIIVERRSIDRNVDQFPGLVAELLQLNVDVLVVVPLAALRAVKKATQTTPVVMVATVDPVAAGIVDSLARPGGNITGLTTLSRELSGKRLELFKELVPRLSRIAVLGDADAPVLRITLKEYEASAHALKIQLLSLAVRGPNPDLERTFQGAVKERANGLVTIANPMLSRYLQQIVDLAIKNRLPSTSDGSGYVEAGFLMSYSANILDQHRRAAIYVDKILKGAKPADLPVEQPTKFELIINLKTAKQIGLKIPPNMLARADKVIK